ncbi:MAG: 4-hydroxybenzoate 3-monooxygenase [Alphaproteobacteria bacterium]|nr:MAG: 4-hydroxybenzoate 3-monooxygenase [Caulobacteraceae bacterium]TPW08220.1 MAG: 4-hydroxybenzoate 3-monooxygenase [Alphaproteobacteria bacterium]
MRLRSRAAPHITRGPTLEKSTAPLRSLVFEPLRRGSLFLAVDGAFDHRMQISEFDYIGSSEAMLRVIAENYVCLPL